MRSAIVGLALALVLAGCADPEPADPGTDPSDPPAGTAPAEPAPPSEPAAIVEVLNETARQGLPGGTGSLSFDVPGGYMELFLTARDGTTLRGDISMILRDPGGNETQLLTGTYVHDDAGSSPVPCACEWRINNPGAGTWTLEWTVQGDMTLPLRGLAQ